MSGKMLSKHERSGMMTQKTTLKTKMQAEKAEVRDAKNASNGFKDVESAGTRGIFNNKR